MKLGEYKGFLEVWANECFKWDTCNKLTNKVFKGQQPRSPFGFRLRSITVKGLAITLFYVGIFVMGSSIIYTEGRPRVLIGVKSLGKPTLSASLATWGRSSASEYCEVQFNISDRILLVLWPAWLLHTNLISHGWNHTPFRTAGWPACVSKAVLLKCGPHTSEQLYLETWE